MPLATTYTFGDALLTVLEFALLFLWIWIAVGVVFDIFRSSDRPIREGTGCSSSSSSRGSECSPTCSRGHKMHEHHERERAQASLPASRAAERAVQQPTSRSSWN